MKRLALTTVVTLTAILGFSFVSAAQPSVNLEGLWQMTMDIVNRDGISYSDKDDPEYQYLVVSEQDGDLFKGFGCPLDSMYPERTDFYGLLEGKTVHITSWDSLTSGSVNNAGTEMNAITQVQQYKDDSQENASSIASVVATKVSSDPESDCPNPE